MTSWEFKISRGNVTHQEQFLKETFLINGRQSYDKQIPRMLTGLRKGLELTRYSRWNSERFWRYPTLFSPPSERAPSDPGEQFSFFRENEETITNFKFQKFTSFLYWDKKSLNVPSLNEVHHVGIFGSLKPSETTRIIVERTCSNFSIRYVSL